MRGNNWVQQKVKNWKKNRVKFKKLKCYNKFSMELLMEEMNTRELN